MNKSNFSEMYPVLKKLFFCYIDYIRYSADHSVDVDEGNYLPGNIEEIKSLFQQLNTWLPLKINNS